MTDADPLGNEPLFDTKGQIVGRATSGYYGHTVGKSLAIGYVKADFAAAGTQLSIQILGERKRATVLVGPALILTSIVLACALAALMLSDLPTLRLFGGLSSLAMLAAMFADLTILRPTITYLMRRSRGDPLAESASQESSAIL